MSESSNMVNLRLPIELLMLIREDSMKYNQLSAVAILRILTEHFKEQLIQNHGKDFYNELVTRYSMSVHESRKFKELREKEKDAKKQAKIKKLLEEKAHWQNKLNNPNFMGDRDMLNSAVERHVREINENLKELGYEEP